MASLNPVMTVGRQLMEVPMLHDGLGERAASGRGALDMLAEVKLLDGESVLARVYPHQLSAASSSAS
jgi:peptide/nickel transport system ATP-binding protein